MPTDNLLTVSRLVCLRRCAYQHWLRYEQGLARDRDDAPLARIGTVFHGGLARAHSTPPGDPYAALLAYEAVPQNTDPHAWGVERETVRNLLAGHLWRYQDEKLEYVRVEHAFCHILRNPDTGKRVRGFRLAGKIDDLVIAGAVSSILERKTTGDDIAPESQYWLRLRRDPQISHYMIGARLDGHNVSRVLYDATRRPSIGPVQVPTLDADGLKIVLDAAGQRVIKKDGTPRLSADAEKGYVLQARIQTPEEFGARLLKDIGERPDFYFGRREIARTDGELATYQREVCQEAELLRYRRCHNLWPASVSKWNCPWCSYADLCLQGITVWDGDSPPAGYKRLENVHPELAAPAPGDLAWAPCLWPTWARP